MLGTNLRKLKIVLGLVPYTIKDTRVFLREIAKPIVRPRTKSIILRKFPTPYLSTLEDPSINKARSIFALQADKKRECKKGVKKDNKVRFLFEIPVLKTGFEVDYAMFCLKINTFPLTQ